MAMLLLPTLLAARQEQFAKAMLDRMKADGAYLVGQKYNYIREMHPGDLQTVIYMMVEGGAIPLRDELTESIYPQILSFFTDFMNSGGIRYDRNSGSGKVTKLWIGSHGMDYRQHPPETLHRYAYLHRINETRINSRVSRTIEKLDGLQSLNVKRHCSIFAVFPL